jgi:hypothetical protein
LGRHGLAASVETARRENRLASGRAGEQSGYGRDECGRLVLELVGGRAQELVAGGLDGVAFSAVVFERRAGAVVVPAVDLDGEPLGAPEEVDVEAGQWRVEGRTMCLTSASSTARSSWRGVRVSARSRRVRAGEVSGRPWRWRVSCAVSVRLRWTLTPAGLPAWRSVRVTCTVASVGMGSCQRVAAVA